MNSRERVRKVMRGEIPDRVPVFPVITDMHTTYMYDIPLWQASVFPRLKYDLLEMAVREYGFDGFEAPVGPALNYGAHFKVADEGDRKFLYDNGLKVLELHQDNYPTPVIAPKMPAVSDVAQLKKMVYSKTADYVNAGCLEELLRLRKRFGNDAYISSHAAGFTMNGLVNLRGSEQAFLDVYDEPEFALEMLDFLTSQAIEAGRAIADAGMDCIYIGDAFSSCSLISPSIFKEFCLPFYKRFVNALKDKDIDIYLHICGNSSPLFEMMAETGVNAIEPLDPLGGVKVADAKLRVGNKVALKGGVNTLTLMSGSVDDVIAESKACLEQGMKGGGFILGSGDDIPRTGKRENIIAMVETAHRYGKY